MIYFLVTRRNRYPLQNFLRSSGSRFAGRIKIIHYESLEMLQNLQAGTFIFSDFDLLTVTQREVVKSIYAQIQARYPHLKLYNDPRSVLLRYDLLKKLYEKGINRFNVARASESFEHLQFPLFVREADRHNGPLTPLLYSAKDLTHHIKVFKALGYNIEDLLIVEYLNASDHDGIFSKMSSFFVNNNIVPRYLNFSSRWMVKSRIHHNKELMKSRQPQVEGFMHENPHQTWLKNIFTDANITYGRADYTVVDGIPQLWEINLNPAFVLPPKNKEKDHPMQQFMREKFFAKFLSELEIIDHNHNEMIQLTISAEELKKMKLSFTQRLREGFQSRLYKNKPHYRVMKFFSFSYARFVSALR